MRNYTNELKKNALRIVAGAMTAVTLAATPLAVSAATRTNNPEANIVSQISEPVLLGRKIPIILSENTTSSVQGIRVPRQIASNIAVPRCPLFHR